MQSTKLISALLTIFLLTGCATGFDAATQQQDPTGNGRSVAVGDLQVQNMTVVAGETNAALLMKIFNDTTESDRLLQLTIGNQNVLTDVAIPANTKVAYGNAANPAHIFELSAQPGGYLPVRMQFERAGIYETSVLVVAPVNQYAGLVD